MSVFKQQILPQQQEAKLTILIYGYNRTYNVFKIIIWLLWPTESDGNK